MGKAAGGAEAVDWSNVVPAVHAAALLDGMQARSGPGDRGARFYREPLVDDLDLVVAYVEEGPSGARILRERDVVGRPWTGGPLRARAVANLRRRLRVVERYGGPDVYMVSAGGTYEASLLLVDAFWDPTRMSVDGDFVAAVPGRDVLMVTGSRCAIGMARLRHLAREAYGKDHHPLTPELLVRHHSCWTRSGSGDFLPGL